MILKAVFKIKFRFGCLECCIENYTWKKNTKKNEEKERAMKMPAHTENEAEKNNLTRLYIKKVVSLLF